MIQIGQTRAYYSSDRDIRYWQNILVDAPPFSKGQTTDSIVEALFFSE